MNRKVLLGLLIVNTQAPAVTTLIGGKIGIDFLRFKRSFNELFNVGNAKNDLTNANRKLETQKDIKVDGSTVELSSDIKKLVPISADLSARVLVGSEFKAGVGCEIGAAYFLNKPTDGWYGTRNAVAVDANLPSAATFPLATRLNKGELKLFPHVALAMDVADIKVILSLGLDMRYREAMLDYASGYTAGPAGPDVLSLAHSITIRSWISGVKVGVEGLYKLNDSVSLGLGVNFTYFPEATAAYKGTYTSFLPALTGKTRNITDKGSWSIGLSAAAYFDPAI